MMAYMSQHLGRAVGGTVAVLTCLVALLVILHDHPSASSSADPQAARDPVYLDEGTTFTPKLLPTEARYLTADEAWTKWERGQHLPPEVTPEFGRLNDQGRIHLVWAYDQGGCSLPLNGPREPQQSPKCSSWTFLNPRTGRHVLTTSVYATTP